MNCYDEIKKEFIDNEGYSLKLTKDIGKKYSVRYLFDIRRLYLFSKVHPLGAQLIMSHYRLIFQLNDDKESWKKYNISTLYRMKNYIQYFAIKKLHHWCNFIKLVRIMVKE